jgi:hypothetical protein
VPEIKRYVGRCDPLADRDDIEKAKVTGRAREKSSPRVIPGGELEKSLKSRQSRDAMGGKINAMTIATRRLSPCCSIW